MSRPEQWTGPASAWRRRAGVIGVAALVVSVIGAFVDAARFFQAYLLGFAWWLGIGLGAMPVLMLHHLVGGRWGFLIRRVLEASIRTLPVLALLFLPVLAGMSHLYEWTHADVVAGDPVLEHKSAYLNTGFFMGRALLYFAVWIAWALYLGRWSDEQDRDGDPAVLRKLQLLSAAGLLVYGLTITFASVDWVMSLSPHWYSTIFGMLFMVGQVLAALSFSILVVVALSSRAPLGDIITARHLHDLGNLVLTFVLLWAYISFSQFLIIWSGNLPEEIPFYLARTAAGWQWVSALLILFHFAVPFALLLSRRTKRTARVLVAIAAGLLVMRWVDLYWLIVPAFGEGLAPHWLDLTLSAGIGGVWIWTFLGQLVTRPLVPVNDPRTGRVPAVQEAKA